MFMAAVGSEHTGYGWIEWGGLNNAGVKGRGLSGVKL